MSDQSGCNLNERILSTPTRRAIGVRPASDASQRYFSFYFYFYYPNTIRGDMRCIGGTA